MGTIKKPYPALKFKVFSPFYDLIVKALTPENRIRQELTQKVLSYSSLLDFGCGTGTFLKNLPLGVFAEGFDPDPYMQKKAQHKSKRVVHLNLPNKKYQCICATWVFHHLNDQEKTEALKSILKRLSPKGTLFIGDWGLPKNLWSRCMYLVLETLDTKEGFRPHRTGDFLQLLKNLDLNISECSYTKTFLGTYYLWECQYEPEA